MDKQTFKELYSKEQRVKMFNEAHDKYIINNSRDPNLIVVIVEKDPKCKVFPLLKYNRFKIGKENKFFEMYTAIRKRILDMGDKYESHSLFLFTRTVLPNKGKSLLILEMTIG